MQPQTIRTGSPGLPTKPLRRRHPGMGSKDPREWTIIAGPIAIKPFLREVRINGELVALTPKEYQLLLKLAEHPTRAVPRAEIYQNLWGIVPDMEISTRRLDSHAAKLRRRLAEHNVWMVINVWGVGYRLMDAPRDGTMCCPRCGQPLVEAA